MGWFITQSLAFIIIAALIGLAIGIWIGWLGWGRRAKGKHTAEKADAATRSAAKAGANAGAAKQPVAAAQSAPALATAGTDEAASAVGTDTAVPVGDGASGSAGDADGPADEAADGGKGSVEEGDGATSDGEPEVGAAGSDVVAEAEAVAREAAEADAAAKVEAEPAGESDVEPIAEADADADAGAGAEAVAGEAAAAAADETPDDLQRIEGIGPKIATALVAAGYPTYAKIADASEDELREAVAGQGIKFAPAAASWADQARYLVDSDAKGLEEYQDYLIGGQERRAKFQENVDYADVDEIEGADAKAAALAEDEAEAAAATEAAEEPAAEAATEPEASAEPEDLRRIEGVGPKIEAALKAAGYTTYTKLAVASEDELRAALTASGITFAPAATSWADQAQYLADGDEDGLREYQDYLIGGQDRAAKFRENVDYADVDEIEGADAKAAAIAQDEAEAAAAAEAAEEPAAEEPEAAEAGTEAEASAEPEAAEEPEVVPAEAEPQDLQRIEGIGPKIESTLKAAGYATYAKIAGASEAELREALATGGIKFAPAATSWAEQAQFLADGDEEGLQEFQDYLIGGQDRRSKFNENVDYTDVDEIEDADAKAAAIADDEAKAAAAEGDAEPTQSGVKA